VVQYFLSEALDADFAAQVDSMDGRKAAIRYVSWSLSFMVDFHFDTCDVLTDNYFRDAFSRVRDVLDGLQVQGTDSTSWSPVFLESIKYFPQLQVRPADSGGFCTITLEDFAWLGSFVPFL
jgi:hypothetical protein